MERGVGGLGGDLAVCKLDDEKEGGKVGRKVKEDKRREGSSQLHWYEYDAEAAATATSPLFSSTPSMPTEKGERRRGREGTVSMATAEQR